MRKHRVPPGWPRRDSKHHRFVLPNEVWEYELRPVAFVIFSCLCYRRTHGRERKIVSVKAVADSLHLATATVETHLVTLVNKGLVAEDGTSSLRCEAGKFFTLPNEIFLLNLPSSAFEVYAYLLLIENRRTHTCHPS